MRNRIPRSVTIASSVAVFLAAATWAHLSARAQVPSLPLPRVAPLLAPRLPVTQATLTIPMISIDGRITAGSNLILRTRNVGASANGRRIRLVKTQSGAAVFLNVVSWTADRITVAVPARPFGAFAGSVPVLVGIWDGSRWVGRAIDTFLWAGALSRGPRPAGCGTRDWDQDGHDFTECGGDDCNDADGDRFPGNAEVCDAAAHDEDCDASTFGRRDADGDGSWDASCCNVDVGGGRICGDDCDDYLGGAHPGLPEACDQRDNDCDSQVDEGVQHVLWADRDGDGFGDPAQPRQACWWSAGLSYVPNDCNDGDRQVFMGHGCQ